MGFLLRLLADIRAILAGIFDPVRCPIGWQPTALAPVFFGFRDYEARFPPTTHPVSKSGAVVVLSGHPCRVFFPSLDGSPDSGAILKYCGRYPLIVFAHGMCTEPDHYKKWFNLPSLLARAGYVVVVPKLRQNTLPSAATNDLDVLHGIIGWMRSTWEYRETLLPAPATGIAGHSLGGGLAALLVATYPGEIEAWASLSGQTGVGLAPLATVAIPKLFMFGDGQFEAPLQDLNPAPSSAGWLNLLRPKHSALLKDIGHWDYLEPGTTMCEEGRGACALTPLRASQLLIMFFGRYLKPENAPDLRPRIAPSLVPPSLSDLGLTLDQEFYAGGGWLNGWDTDPRCRVDLTWDIGADSGTLTTP